MRIAVLALMALPALALAGMPGTSGWVAKNALKTALEGAPLEWTIWLGTALFVANLGTTLLMLRALFLLARAAHKPESAHDVVLPWFAMTALVIFGLGVANISPDVAKAASRADLLPIVTAGILAGLGCLVFHYAGLRMEPAAPGELLGMVRVVSQPEPALKPKTTKRAHPLFFRGPSTALLRPERGALAILSIAVGLALFLALMPTPATVSPSLPAGEYAQ